MLFDILNGFEEKILILNSMYFLEKVVRQKIVAPSEVLLAQILAHVYSTDSVRKSVRVEFCLDYQKSARGD